MLLNGYIYKCYLKYHMQLFVCLIDYLWQQNQQTLSLYLFVFAFSTCTILLNWQGFYND